MRISLHTVAGLLPPPPFWVDKAMTETSQKQYANAKKTEISPELSI